jgi:hypothetical protein
MCDEPTLWQSTDLAKFSMDPHHMVHDLDDELSDLVWAYVRETSHSEEIPEIIREIARRYPRYLRVKELFETFECYRRIGQEIYEQWRLGRVKWIYDLACGHGLLGLLLAWRFRSVQVVCVDLERRPAFDHYLEVVSDWGTVLDNISYVEGDLNDVSLETGAYAICIHACNEATQVALEKAVQAQALYATMPCCIRDGIYFRRIKHANDSTRYATAVGFIAGQYHGYKISSIEEVITNRNLIIFGDATQDSRS